MATHTSPRKKNPSAPQKKPAAHAATAAARTRVAFGFHGMAFLVLSLAYLVAEFLFNVSLLDVAGSVRASPEDIQHVTEFGRIVSACGFTLLTLGVFARQKFRLADKRYIYGYFIFAAVCAMPILFLQEGRQYLLFLMAPAFGIFIMSVSRGRFAFHTLLAIVLTAWPSMYVGQKILIESYVVNPTTWEQRRDARNILMLRSGLEDCIVELEGLWLCEGNKTGPEVRAVRALITSLWMHDPQGIIAALEPQRQKIIENTANRGGWFSPRAQYEKYIKIASGKRDEFEKQLLDEYYAPYKQASDMYIDAMSPQKAQDKASAAWAMMESETDKAWKEYLQAVRDYNQQIRYISSETIERYGRGMQMMDSFCSRHNCAGTTPDKMILRLQDAAETRFIDKAGVPPNVQTKEEFLAYPRTREVFEQKVSAYMEKETGTAGIGLPLDWYYEESYMKAFVINALRSGVTAEWQRHFGKDLKPGLSPQALFDYYKLPPLPDLNKLVLSEDEFTRTQVQPRAREMVVKMLKSMEDEAPLYANGEELAEKGKNYIRAIYIPTIALVISLVIVLITITRGVNAGLKIALANNPVVLGQPSRHWRYGGVAAFVLLLALLPYMVTNDFTKAKVYHDYVAQARTHNAVTADLLDWAIHMQPVIYSVGRVIKTGF